MRGAGRAGRTVTLRLRFDDFGRATRSRSMLKSTLQTRAILDVPRSFPTRRSSDLLRAAANLAAEPAPAHEATHDTTHDSAHDIESRIRRSEEHTSELQSPVQLVCRLLLEKKKSTRRWPPWSTG